MLIILLLILSCWPTLGQQQQSLEQINEILKNNVKQKEFDDRLLRYDAPDDCRYSVTNSDVNLICNLRTVNSEFDTTNFSVIPSEHTVSLTIHCNDEIMAKSSLEPKSFSHLNKLKELVLEYCKIVKFKKEILFGLDDLRNLTIRTNNIHWPALSLEIEVDSFHYTKNLEKLDFSQNNIWSIPENLFCNLNGLIWLNVSENRLQDVNDLGFRENQLNKSQTLCSIDLQMLDISFNHFVLLPPNGFGLLKRLKFIKIQNNEISMISDTALGGLKNLQVINLNSNKIVALPSKLFQDSMLSIQEIYLHNNSISVLSPGLFSNLEQLQALDLSINQLTSSWINRNTFLGLIRLVLLNLSNNKLTKLESEIFSDLYQLQILNLCFNRLSVISADTFSPMNNLHTLLLSHNKIKYLDAYSLNGLYVLSLLSIDNNLLTGIHPEAFRNCSAIQDLNLNGNELKIVPLALKDMRLLRTVDLGENQIQTIDEIRFRGLSNLYGLRLIGNKIVNISRTSFRDLPSLQILNLARNKISYIENGAFETTTTIQAIRLDGNQLTNISDLFQNMRNLLWLNISDNRLDEFDFSNIPNSLQWLDLHKNSLTDLSNKFLLDNQLRLQTLDASFNRLEKITSNSFPNSIELLFLNDNVIRSIEEHTFKLKTNLTRVDLYANQITSLDIKSLRLDPIDGNKFFLPEFYIGGNPFICDCNIEWLQKINQVTSRQFPRVMDLETIYCKLLYNRDRSYIQLVDAQPSHFLCPYKTHCFALCQCCEFDACDCEMTCPNNCSCFHDQSWSSNVVECSNSGYNEIPLNIPMDTTELYIDGNNFGYELPGHSFIGRKNLKILFANHSNIQIIYNTTFIGLKRLQVLHLENNRIKYLHGNEFYALENLKELYLQENYLTSINNRTFIGMKKLEVLRLDRNRLTKFEVWELIRNPYLVQIGFSENYWSCDCEYLNQFRNFLQLNGEKIFDSNKITCVYNNLTSILKKDKNGTKFCTLNDDEYSTNNLQSKSIIDLLPFLLAGTCAIVGFFGLIFGVICYRRDLKLWTQHNNCFTTNCYKSTNLVNDFEKERLYYDAYLTYSAQDDHFINQILSTTLENDLGYRLCLHYRDCNINSFSNQTDIIVEAAESSKCIILVLSKKFLCNEWSRFEYKSAIYEILKRRKKIIFILYGDLPQRDIDHNMRLYLKANTCIEWDDNKFWQKLRMVLPNVKLRIKNNYLNTIHDPGCNINHDIQTNQLQLNSNNLYTTSSLSSTDSLSIENHHQHHIQHHYHHHPQQPPPQHRHQNDIGRLDYNNFFKINCDNFKQINSTTDECHQNNRSQLSNNINSNLTTNLDLRNNHDYAVPSTCLYNDGNNIINSIERKKNGCCNIKKQNECALNIENDNESDKYFTYSCKNNCNCSNYSNDNNDNGTNSCNKSDDVNINDKLPQAIWA